MVYDTKVGVAVVAATGLWCATSPNSANNPGAWHSLRLAGGGLAL